MKKSFKWLSLLIALILVLAAVVGVSAKPADPPDNGNGGGSTCDQDPNCDIIDAADSGTWTAPDGNNVTQFCLKAGQDVTCWGQGDNNVLTGPDGACWDVEVDAGSVDWDRLETSSSCQNMSHGEGSYSPTSGNPTDVCPNIPENQGQVPTGYHLNQSGECVPDAVDYCPNIDGDQDTVPDGMTVDESGNCVTPPTDVCSNLDGLQTEVPDGYTSDGQGNCNSPATDKCPNIDGDQATVPDGMTIDNQGNCTIPSTPIDVCSNLPGDQATVPDGYTSDGNNGCNQTVPEIDPYCSNGVTIYILVGDPIPLDKDGRPATPGGCSAPHQDYDCQKAKDGIWGKKVNKDNDIKYWFNHKCWFTPAGDDPWDNPNTRDD